MCHLCSEEKLVIAEMQNSVMEQYKYKTSGMVNVCVCVVEGVLIGFRGVTETGSTLHCKAKPVSPQEALLWKVILKCIIMGNLLNPNY